MTKDSKRIPAPKTGPGSPRGAGDSSSAETTNEKRPEASLLGDEQLQKNRQETMAKLIGLGERSTRKSYYPQLRKKVAELERFHMLVDRASDAILMIRLKDEPVIAYVNQAATKLTGMEEHELKAAGLTQVVGEGAAAFIAAAQVDETQGGATLTFSLARGDEVVPVEATVTGHMVDEELETVLYGVVVARDISERVQAQEEMRMLRNLLSNIINSMPSALIGVDPDCMVMQWNTQAEHLTGVPIEQALGRPLDDVFPRLSGKNQVISSAIASGEPTYSHKQAHPEGGSIKYEDVTIYPLMANGIRGAVIRVDDVTEKVRLEQMMLQTEKMISLGGLAAGIAHEINNPLAGIQHGVQNVQRRLSEKLKKNHAAAEEAGFSVDMLTHYLTDRGVLRMLDGIRESADRAASIVSNMLLFARKTDDTHHPEDIHALLDTAVTLASSDYDLKKKFDFRHVEIVREYDGSVPAIMCQRMEIEQVFLNLLRNAAQAMHDMEHAPEQHTIILSTRKVDGFVEITVADNGPGMDADVQMRVFEPFFTTKPPGVGTGLGMSVSYFIITRHHNGIMDVTSQPGKGTAFTIRLPMHSSHAG